MLHGKKVIGTVGLMCGLPSVLTEFAESMIQMVDFNGHYVCGPNQRIKYLKTGHSFHSIARNDLVDSIEGDWLLQLDTDHAFDPDLLARLLLRMNKYDADVVGGFYLHKKPPYNPTIWGFIGDDDKAAYQTDWPTGEILEVGVVGTGCLLARRQVFERIVDELGEHPFSTAEYSHTIGEDFAFARRCKKLGIRIIVDPEVECHHLYVERLSVAKHYPEGSR